MNFVFVYNCMKYVAKMLFNLLHNMQVSVPVQRSCFMCFVVSHFYTLEKRADFHRHIFESKYEKSGRFSSEMQNFVARNDRVQNELTSISIVFDILHSSVIGLLQREYNKEFYNSQVNNEISL